MATLADEFEEEFKALDKPTPRPSPSTRMDLENLAEAGVTTSDTAFLMGRNIGKAKPSKSLHEAALEDEVEARRGYKAPPTYTIQDPKEAKDIAAHRLKKPKTLAEDFDDQTFKLTAEEPRTEGLWDKAKKIFSKQFELEEAQEDIQKGTRALVTKGIAKSAGTVLDSAPAKALFTAMSLPEHSLVKGISDSLGRPKKQNLSDYTYTSFLIDSGLPDDLGTRALGLGLSIFLAPDTYMSFGTTGALKLAKGVTLNKAGQALRNRSIRELTEKEIAKRVEKAGGTELSIKAQNEINDQVTKQVDNELIQTFSGLKAGVKSKDTDIFDLGGIKFADKSVVTGDDIAKVTSKLKDLSKALYESKYVAPLRPTLDEAGRYTAKVKDVFGKAFVPDYGVDRTLLNLWEDTQTEGRQLATGISRITDSFFGGLSPKQREDFAESALRASTRGEKIEVKSLANDPAVQAKLDRFYAQGKYKGRQSIADRFAKWSKLIEDEKLPNWFPGIDKKLRQASLEIPKGVGPSEREFLKSRQAGDDISQYTRDPVKALATRWTQIAYANLQDKMFEKIVKDGIGGVTTLDKIPPNVRHQYVPIRKPFGNTLLDDTKDVKSRVDETTYYAPKDFANQYRQIIQAYKPSSVLSLIEKPTKLFKAGVTVAFPAFHARNFAANTVLNSYSIGGHAWNPAKHAEALQILRGKNLDKVITTQKGEKLTRQALIDEAKANGAIKDMFFDIAGDNADSSTKTILQHMLSTTNPFSVDFGLYKMGRKVGAAIEDQARLLNYIEWRRRGLSPKLAAQEANDALFDYAKITNFEKDANLVIPFYTFSRKNLDKHMKLLRTNPKAVTAQMRFYDALSPTEEDLDSLGEQAKKNIAIKIGRNFYKGFGLPIEDVLNNMDITGREALVRLNPMLRVPIEKTIERDIYSDRPIEEINNANEFGALYRFAENKDIPQTLRAPVQKVLNFLKIQQDPSNPDKYTGDADMLHILRALPSSRFQSVLGYVEKDRDLWEKVLRLSTGVVKLDPDEEAAASRELPKTLKEHKKAILKSNVARSIDIPYFITSDKALQKELNRQRNELMGKMSKKLRITPPVTEQREMKEEFIEQAKELQQEEMFK